MSGNKSSTEIYLSKGMSLPCPICSGSGFKFFDHSDYFSETVSLFKCINCGHGFYSKPYTTEQLKELYQESYAENYLNQDITLNKQRHLQYSLDVELLLKISKLDKDSKIKVLDYGCSSGSYLDAMPALWSKSGFEVNPFHINYLRTNKPNIEVFNDLECIDGGLDLVTMRGVIEHIPVYGEVIDFLNKRLKLGATLFISATPDFSSVCASLYKEHWNQVCCPVHIHQFTATSLSLLFAQAGFVLEALHHPYQDTPYADWVNDSNDFIFNFKNSSNQAESSPKRMRHAFPGNMMSLLFRKVR